MIDRLKARLAPLLRSTERYTKTDMVYLARSNFWLHATSFLVSFASFFLYILFGHVLPKDVYGTYQYLLSVGALVGALTLTGMNSAVVRAVARGFEGTYREAIRVQLLWSIVPLTLAWTLGVYYVLHGNTTLASGLFLIGIFVPLNGTFNTYVAYLTAKKDFRRNFTFSILVNAPYYLAVALVAVSLPTALALLASNLIAQCLGYIAAHRKTLAAYQPNEKRDPEAMRYGAHLSLINFFNVAISQADNILVFHFLGAAELALYSFVTAIPDRLSIFRNLAAAAFPKFAARTPADTMAHLGRKVLLSIGGATIVAALYALFAHPIFALFFPNYLEAVPYSQAYAFIIAAAAWPLFTSLLTAHGRVRSLYAYNLTAPLLQLTLQVFGILYAGLWGLIAARLAGALLSSLIAWVLVSLTPSESVPAPAP